MYDSSNRVRPSRVDCDIDFAAFIYDNKNLREYLSNLEVFRLKEQDLRSQMLDFKGKYVTSFGGTELKEKHSFKFCALPDIVLLTLIAYQKVSEILHGNYMTFAKS